MVAWTSERPIDQHTMEVFWVRVQQTVHLRRVLPHFSSSTNLAASWSKSSQPIDNNVVFEIRSTEPPAIYFGLPIAKYVSAGDLLLRGWFALRQKLVERSSCNQKGGSVPEDSNDYLGDPMDPTESKHPYLG